MNRPSLFSSSADYQVDGATEEQETGPDVYSLLHARSAVLLCELSAVQLSVTLISADCKASSVQSVIQFNQCCRSCCHVCVSRDSGHDQRKCSTLDLVDPQGLFRTLCRRQQTWHHGLPQSARVVHRRHHRYGSRRRRGWVSCLDSFIVLVLCFGELPDIKVKSNTEV